METKRNRGRSVGLLAAAFLLLGGTDARGQGATACEATASDLFRACKHEALDDAAVAEAICNQEANASDRRDCLADARSERRDAGEECDEQRRARVRLCDQLGEDRYDANFDPALFETSFAAPANPNPYFPLGVGDRWVLQGGSETIEIEVLAKTKAIEGVTCVVVRDVAKEGGRIVEDTDDWFGLRKDATVDYCGEISQSFDYNAADVPVEAELVETEGSWKAGRDGAQAGTLFPGTPHVGDVYRQEFAPGDAEDAARVLSTTYAYGQDATLDQLVPAALAQLLCAAADCVVTKEFTPLEPGEFERKYYARGIGLFLETKPADGESVRLISCNVDARCASLP